MLKLLRGTLLFKFLVSVIMVGAVWGISSERLSSHYEAAEKVHLEVTISSLRSALRLEVADLLSKGREDRIGTLVGQNPMQWLENRPGNYAGEAAEADPKARVGGNWYFDPATGTLTYWVQTGSKFKPDGRNQKKVRLRIQSDVRSVEVGKLQHNKTPGVRLVLLDQYQWGD